MNAEGNFVVELEEYSPDLQLDMMETDVDSSYPNYFPATTSISASANLHDLNVPFSVKAVKKTHRDIVEHLLQSRANPMYQVICKYDIQTTPAVFL